MKSFIISLECQSFEIYQSSLGLAIRRLETEEYSYEYITGYTIDYLNQMVKEQVFNGEDEVRICQKEYIEALNRFNKLKAFI